MSNNLIETVSNYFTPGFVNQASSNLGETDSGISKALAAIIPTGLAGIMKKATSGPEGENSIFDMASESALGLPSSPAFDSLASYSAPAAKDNLLSSLFSGNQTGIVSAIAGFAGIKNATVSSLLSMGVPVIMGLLGRHAKQNNLSASGLSGMLADQKNNIIRAMPAGVSSLGSMFGLGSASTAYASSPTPPRASVQRTEETVSGGGNKWLLPLVIGLAAIGLLWYFLRGCNDAKVEAATTTAAVVTSTDTVSTTVTTAVVTAPESIKVKLPNGKELDANRGGIEDQLVTFLSGNWKGMSEDALKEKWFDFDNLNFNTGKATLLPESERQLKNIAEILKAFPDAKIKIGGYTDASGNTMANKRLSQDRADAAKAGLERLGVSAQVLEAEGYGSEFAKFPADASEDQRVLDRHVSISVRE